MSVRTVPELNRKSFWDHRDFLLGVDGGGRRAEAISKAIMKTLAYHPVALSSAKLFIVRKSNNLILRNHYDRNLHF
jgi:hypothetical protein